MRSCFFVAFTLMGALGCSGKETDGTPGAGGGGPTGDGRLFVPEDLPNTELQGQEGGLTLVAFTLEQHEGALQPFAAVKNEGSAPACGVGMMLDARDETGGLLTSTAGGVEAGHFYVVDDGSGVVLPCIPPGGIGMAALARFSQDLTLEALRSLEHSFPAFGVDVLPLSGVALSSLAVRRTVESGTYAGTFKNGLDVTVGDPTVAVFPLNRVGRPLGVARASGSTDVAPGGSWTFETTGVPDIGVGYAAFPGGSVEPVP
jgi:hypothetical protein